MSTMTSQQEALLSQVNKGKKEYITDEYSMSINELVGMYKEGELIINPDFQRMFRWSSRQQSRLIESILIGVPLPYIFVYQNEDGKWEVVDGVQRISTILAFMGVLKKEEDPENENIKVPSVLEKTKILPALEGMTWENMPKEPLQLEFKRSKITVKIIKSQSDKNAKFEVFQRLNSGGSLLSDQEFRNCMLIMVDKAFYVWMCNLSENQHFRNCLNLSDKLIKEKYHQELVLRLFVFSKYIFSQKTVDAYIDDSLFDEKNGIMQLVSLGQFVLEEEKNKFEKVFYLLDSAAGEEAFKKSGRQKFLESYFEAIAVGLYSNIENYSDNGEDLELISKKIKEIESFEAFSSFKGSGSNSSLRIPKITKFGKDYFRK